MSEEQIPFQGAGNIFNMQNRGYANTAKAISEIVDNSIQASANKIQIILVGDSTVMNTPVCEVIIIDNGTGMDRSNFRKSLQMNSGSRGNAHGGLGKYGQGLPSSSISQTLRTEIFTKSKSENSILFNYLDLNEMHESKSTMLPALQAVDSIGIPLIAKGLISFPETGTLVRWINPNKSQPKLVQNLANNLKEELGRIFRYIVRPNGYKDEALDEVFKADIDVIIAYKTGNNYELKKNDETALKPFDPMFLMSGTQIDHIQDQPSNIEHARTSENFSIDHPYEKDKKINTQVEIVYSYVNEEIRFSHGRNAGSTPFGELYKGRLTKPRKNYPNISILRAGREIDCGIFGFNNEIKQTDRWWSVEIHLTPLLDDICGVEQSKQKADSIKYINPESTDLDEYHEVLIHISKEIIANISSLRNIIKEQGENNGGQGGGGKINIDPEPGPAPGPKPSDEELEENKLILIKWITERYENVLTEQEIEKEAVQVLELVDHHIFITTSYDEEQLYDYTVIGDKVIIEVNKNHTFYQSYIDPFQRSQYDAYKALRLLIGSMVSAEIGTKNESNTRSFKHFNTQLGMNLHDYVEKVNNN